MAIALSAALLAQPSYAMQLPNKEADDNSPVCQAVKNLLAYFILLLNTELVKATACTLGVM